MALHITMVHGKLAFCRSCWSYPSIHVTTMVQILFVHGMGRSPLSAWPMLRRLRHAGFATETFGYLTSMERFDAISARLADVIKRLQGGRGLVLIGHSLGGVLIRAALARQNGLLKAPRHVFVLGSPQSASKMARGLAGNPVFRLLSGDCGQLLASPEAMAGIPPLASRATSIVGIRPIPFIRIFGCELNDGVVALSEVRALWLRDEVQLNLIHSVLPASKAVTGVVLARLEQRRADATP